MITDKAYFSKQPLYIEQSGPNNGIPSDVFAADSLNLDSSIRTYEARYLKYLLGKALCSEFISTISDSKWTDLKSMLWETVPGAQGESPIPTESPVAEYIYFWHLNDFCARYNGEVFKQAKSENTVSIQVAQKQVWVWGEMIKKTNRIKDWLLLNIYSIETESALDRSEWDLLKVNYNTFGI